VILVRTKSFEDAIKKAETEAKAYAKWTHTNPYGQTVKLRRMPAIEVFERFDNPDEMVEAWSSTMILPVSVPDERLVDRFFGPPEPNRGWKRRMKYFNKEFWDNPEKGLTKACSRPAAKSSGGRLTPDC